MRNRLLFVSHSADIIGPTNSLSLLASELGRSHDVAVLMPGHGPFSERLAEQGVPTFSLPSLTKGSLPAIVGLARREKFNLIYANNTRSCSRIAFVAARLAGARYMSHVRSMEWNTSWSRLGYLWFADAVIAVSRACADSVRRFVRSGRLHVVHNGVALDRPSLEREEARHRLRTELGVDESAFVLLSVAHLTRRKAQEHAVAALAEILPASPAAHLCLVGSLTRDPEYVDRLRALAEEAGVDGHVHLLGFRSDTRELFAAADVFVHTAMADPHPRSVVEAMAAGLPVVAFSTDGVAETVANGESGLLVGKGRVDSLAAALRFLAADPEMGRRMGRAGRDRVASRFTARATGAKVGAIIGDVLEPSGERALRVG